MVAPSLKLASLVCQVVAFIFDLVLLCPTKPSADEAKKAMGFSVQFCATLAELRLLVATVF